MAFSLAVFFLPSGCTSTKEIAAKETSTPVDGKYTVVVRKVTDPDSRPAPRGRHADPVYPVEMQQARIEGKVALSFTIDQEGFTRDIAVVSSSNRAFEEPAIDAMRQWRFWPALKDDRPVSFRCPVPRTIRFKLDPMTNAPAIDAISRSKEVDSPPAPRGRFEPPVYPAKMKQARIEGEVVLSFTVDQEGFTRDIKAVSSSNGAFEQPAIDAIKQWRFWPAQKDGLPVSSPRQMPLAFGLN